MYAVEGRRNGRGSMWTLIRLSEQLCVCAYVSVCECVFIEFEIRYNVETSLNLQSPSKQASQGRRVKCSGLGDAFRT